ncbi:Ribosomal RNA-processing protein 7 [Dissophora globulifera]|nr:Ribosomal RNA-processing protein 7 [Dissophora globulifera]
MVSKKSRASDSSSTAADAGASSSSLLDQIANFHILPLRMPSLTLSPTSPHSSPAYNHVLHYLYFKKHESPKQDANAPKDRTLFLLNVPSDATESHLRDLFKSYGRVVAVHFLNRIKDTNLTKEEREQQEELERLEREQAEKEAEAESASGKSKAGKKGGKKQQQQQPTSSSTSAQDEEAHRRRLYASGSQAYVVFLEEQELTKALNMKRKKWLNDYHRMRPVHATLQVKVDTYMEKFERSEYEAQQAALARLNVMDDDGFTLVTRAGNKGYNTDGVIKVQAVKAEDIQNIKPKKKELQDFYRFQMREAKRDKLVDLRRKFEEDKVRIEALKVNRRFKPY